VVLKQHMVSSEVLIIYLQSRANEDGLAWSSSRNVYRWLIIMEMISSVKNRNDSVMQSLANSVE